MSLLMSMVGHSVSIWIKVSQPFSPAAIISVVKTKLETETEPWDELDILRILLKERDTLGLTTKRFMKPLRCAITGINVSLSPPMVISNI